MALSSNKSLTSLCFAHQALSSSLLGVVCVEGQAMKVAVVFGVIALLCDHVTGFMPSRPVSGCSSSAVARTKLSISMVLFSFPKPNFLLRFSFYCFTYTSL